MELYSIKSDSQNWDVKEFTISKNPYTVGNFVTLLLTFILISGVFYAVSSEFTIITGILIIIFITNKLQSIIVKDCLYVFPSLGIQLIQTTLLGTKSGIRFVPMSMIKHVIINECIRRQHVMVYPALIFHCPDAQGRVILPLFEKTFPKIDFVTGVYREVYQTLKEYKLKKN